MEVDEVVQRARALLAEQSMLLLPDPEEAFRRWSTYVRDTIVHLLKAGVNPLFRESWMLRKGVRAQVSIDLLQAIYNSGGTLPDHHARDSEAVRYALIDNTLSSELQALFERGSLDGRPLLLPSMPMLAFAAMAQQWPAVVAVATAMRDARKHEADIALVVSELFGLPASERPEWMTLQLRAMTPARFASLRDSSMEALWRGITEQDDGDNMLSLDLLQIAQPGVAVSEQLAQGSLPMQQWLPSRNPLAEDYIEHLGVALAQRYTEFRLLGNGTFGVVMAASRRARRVALKVTRLRDPIGAEENNERGLAQSELRLNVMIADRRNDLRDEMPYFVWMNDWTRGRMDISRVLQYVPGTVERNQRLMLSGPGIYQVMEMEAWEFVLYDWMRAVERAIGTDRRPLDHIVEALIAMTAVLLGQLYVLRREWPGFNHSDIKNNNVLLRSLRGADHNRSLCDIRMEGGLRMAILPAATFGYAVTLTDLGLASVPGVGPRGRRSEDIAAIGNMLPTTWYTPGGEMVQLARALRSYSDSGTHRDVLNVIQQTPLLSRFVKFTVS